MHFQATSPRDCFEEALYGCLALVYTHRVTQVYTPHLVLPCSQYQTDQYRPTVTHKANMKWYDRSKDMGNLDSHNECKM